jgi:dihydroorotate dehydrogenase/NAD-dependent dihydropyrimidine dehydrogenase PreA subunit
MLDLSVNFAGVELKNPLVVASSDNVRDIRQIKKAEEHGASAIILKAILPPDSIELQSVLRVFVDAKGQTIYGTAGATRLSYGQGVELVKAAKRETRIKIGVNIPFLRFENHELIADAAKRVADVGADFIEINFKPQVSNYLGMMERVKEINTDTGEKFNTVEGHLRDLLMQISEGTRMIKQAVNIPVIAKLISDGVDVLPQALVAERAGADAIDAIGSLSGAYKIDIDDGGRTKIPGARTAVFQLSGAMLKPYSQSAIARISKALKIPVMGTGGLMTWTDVVEIIMFGATTVSFCALLMIHGFEALIKIEKRLRKYMEQQGYNRIGDFRGAALKYVAPSMSACEVIPGVARIDQGKCTGCGKCLKPAHCLAISMENDKAIVNETECLGCGTCLLLCPVQAVSMIEI